MNDGGLGVVGSVRGWDGGVVGCQVELKYEFLLLYKKDGRTDADLRPCVMGKVHTLSSVGMVCML